MIDHECKQEERMLSISVDLGEIKANIKSLDKRINGSIETFYDHIHQGKAWRGAIFAIALSIILQVIAFSYVYGNLSKTVTVNERILQRIVKGEPHEM